MTLARRAKIVFKSTSSTLAMPTLTCPDGNGSQDEVRNNKLNFVSNFWIRLRLTIDSVSVGLPHGQGPQLLGRNHRSTLRIGQCTELLEALGLSAEGLLGHDVGQWEAPVQPARNNQLHSPNLRLSNRTPEHQHTRWWWRVHVSGRNLKCLQSGAAAEWPQCWAKMKSHTHSHHPESISGLTPSTTHR